jgi:hypothetical protein
MTSPQRGRKNAETLLKPVKSPSKISDKRKTKEGSGKLQPINRPKMLKKLSERYESGEMVVVELIRGLLHELCPLYDVGFQYN